MKSDGHKSDGQRALENAALWFLRNHLDVLEAITVPAAIEKYGSEHALRNQLGYHGAQGVATITNVERDGAALLITMTPATVAVPADEVWVLVREK